MRVLYPLIAFLVLIGCGQAYAKSQRFMPENDLHKFDTKKAVNITEGEFNGILDKIEAIYKPIIQGMGANFILERAWEDSTVNAYADRVGNNWYVKMFGGMARRSEINVIGFGLVACHEIGHHIGGFPLYAGEEWAANEGQSDYFSTFVCAKKVLGDYPVPAIPATGANGCNAAYTDQADRDTCYKSVSGGLALANLLARLGGSRTPSLDTPDPVIVPQTQDSHPNAQCRLDTYFAAAKCNKAWNDSVIPRQDGATCDNRPKCWFKGSDSEPGPNPNPNPTPTTQDAEAETALNGFRQARGIPILYSDERLVCAASKHVQDVSSTEKCSHIGSDMSNHSKRLKACGFKGFAAELMACKFPTSQDAMNALNRDRLNAYHIYQRYYKKVGCSRAGSYYVCILAI